MYNFTPPCLDTTLSLTGLGLTAIGQHHTGRHLTVLCLLTSQDDSCPDCQQRGLVRATRIRKLIHPPIGLTSVTLAIRIRTFTCSSCHQRWSQPPTRACVGRSKLSRTARFWALKSVVIDKMSIHVIAKNLATSWNTVCTAVLDLGRKLLIADASRLDGVSTIGVDEHCWSHRGVDRWVTVIVDLTSQPARLLDIVPGRSAEAFGDWLRSQPDDLSRWGSATGATTSFGRYSMPVEWTGSYSPIYEEPGEFACAPVMGELTSAGAVPGSRVLSAIPIESRGTALVSCDTPTQAPESPGHTATRQPSRGPGCVCDGVLVNSGRTEGRPVKGLRYHWTLSAW